MSPHIVSMRASAIQRSIIAILDVINASHAATAFDLGFGTALERKAAQEGGSRTFGSPRHASCHAFDDPFPSVLPVDAIGAESCWH